MRRRIHFVLILLFLSVAVMRAADHRFTLVIDPGHGGHDAGAIGAFSKEKDINLSVALAFGEYVEKNCPDVKVIYTRKTDVFIPLKERAGLANKNNADLFISVHTNALPGGVVAKGFETYTLGMHRAKDNLDVAMRENSVISMEKGYKQNYEGFDPKSSESYIMFEFIQGRNMEKSVDLAKFIQKSVCKGADRPDKGVHQAGFLVLRETSMPSCLIELGFISTPEEETALNDESTQRDIGKAIYKAFKDYKEKYGDQITVPYLPDPIKAPSITPIVPAKSKTSVGENNIPKPVKNDIKKVVSNNNSNKNNSQETAKKTLPIFKIQFMATKFNVNKGDARFKGITKYEYFTEGGMYKWTTGSSSDYNEIYKMRKDMLDSFPEAFIIAFKDGNKVDVVGAIKEYLASKGK